MSAEHGEGGSFVGQIHVDTLMLWWWWWRVAEQHLVAANLVGGHVGRCFRARGCGSETLVLAWDELTVGEREATSYPHTERAKSDKEKPILIYLVMHRGDITISTKMTSLHHHHSLLCPVKQPG